MGLSPPKRAIIGVGNLLCSDEGVGVHIARRLLQTTLPSGIEVLDGGTEGFGLMDAIVGLERLVLVDCVKGGQAPGTIYCFDWADLPENPGTKTSIHQTTVGDVLRHVALIADLPRTTIIGVEPERLQLGLELSRPVAQQLEAVCRLCLQKVG